MEKKMAGGGGEWCFPVLTVLLVCNNNGKKQGGQILSPPECLFSAIVQRQTVAGGDKLVKKNTIWLLF